MRKAIVIDTHGHDDHVGDTKLTEMKVGQTLTHTASSSTKIAGK